MPPIPPSQLPYAANFLNQQNWDTLTAGGDTPELNSAIKMFQNSYKNLTGHEATNEQINDFAMNGLKTGLSAPGQLGYGDQTAITNSYLQNTFGPDIASHQQDLQTQQLGKTQQTIQDLIGKQTAATAADLTNPNSPTYQSFAGQMNNMGITPSSGAFQAGMGGVLGQNASQAINSALGGVSLPTIGGIQGMNQMPLNFAQNNSNLGHLNELGDFGMNFEMGKFLQNQAQPSGFQKDLGYANTSSNILSNLMGTGAQAQMTSYICKELITRGLLCASDMDDFHVHIMPAMFRKGRAFWKYAMDGKNLVDAVNARGLDWKVFKPLLFDRVMDEKDPCAAVDLYSDACHQLCISSNRSLWDQRVYRTSFWDSLLFLPRLLTYKPFLDALGKCLRIKMLIIYDKPTCGVHRGS